MLKSSITLLFVTLAAWALPGIGADSVFGQEKAEGDLLQFVGDDAGLCLEISELNRRLPRFAGSALVDRIEKLPVYRTWKQSREFEKLDDIRKAVERHTGQPLRQFAMNLFGQSVVFVVYPRETGQPAGALLLRAADRESLQTALSAWNDEKRVKLEAVPLSKSEYFKRTEFKRGGSETGRSQFYFVQGTMFALSDDEALIQTIVRRSLGESDRRALSESENYQTAKKSLPEDCWATLYFNPQAWKPGWEFEDGKSRAEILIANLWKRSYSFAAGLRADQGLALDVVLHYDPANLPERWRQLVERTSGFPEFLKHVPADALVVLAGKQDLSGIDELITAEMDAAARQQWQNARQISRGLLLGMDLFNDVLPKLRPNWGVYVVPREPLDPAAVPVEGLLAIQLPAVGEEKGPITVRKAFENALSTGFNLLAAMQNANAPGNAAVVKEETHAGGVVHWVEAVGPYRPAYCLSDEYMIFASSPGLITEFLSPREAKLTDSRVFQLWSEHQDLPEGQLLFVHWQAIRDFLVKHHAFLLNQAVEAHGLPREEAEKRLKRLTEVLQVLDGVYLGMQIQENQIRISIGGITAE